MGVNSSSQTSDRGDRRKLNLQTTEKNSQPKQRQMEEDIPVPPSNRIESARQTVESTDQESKCSAVEMIQSSLEHSTLLSSAESVSQARLRSMDPYRRRLQLLSKQKRSRHCIAVESTDQESRCSAVEMIQSSLEHSTLLSSAESVSQGRKRESRPQCKQLTHSKSWDSAFHDLGDRRGAIANDHCILRTLEYLDLEGVYYCKRRNKEEENYLTDAEEKTCNLKQFEHITPYEKFEMYCYMIEACTRFGNNQYRCRQCALQVRLLEILFGNEERHKIFSLETAYKTENPFAVSFLIHKNHSLLDSNTSKCSVLETVIGIDEQRKQWLKLTNDILFQRIKNRQPCIDLVDTQICKRDIIEPVLVCFVGHTTPTNAEEINGLPVVFRPFHPKCEEAIEVIKHESSILHGANNFILNSGNAHTLFERHSNLNIISKSDLKSIGFKRDYHTMESTSCFVFFVRLKGYIPLLEDELPSKINGYKTDVMEGYVNFGAGYDLRSGEAITRENGKLQGTLGGFVEFQNGKTGFLTCAHVFYRGSDLQKRNLPTGIVVKRVEDNRELGIVKEAVFSFGDHDTTSVDMSVVEIADGLQVLETFSSIPDPELRREGFNDGIPPSYSSGKCLVNIPPDRIRNDLLKFGATTSLTRGRFVMDRTHVRIENIGLSVEENSLSFTGSDTRTMSFNMFHQYEVKSLGPTKFFDSGDSGSFVFMENNGNPYDLSCVGMAIGQTGHGTCIVTPISAILQATSPHLRLKSFMSRPANANTAEQEFMSSGYMSVDQKLDLILKLSLENKSNINELNRKTDDLKQKFTGLNERMERIDRQQSQSVRQQGDSESEESVTSN